MIGPYLHTLSSTHAINELCRVLRPLLNNECSNHSSPRQLYPRLVPGLRACCLLGSTASHMHFSRPKLARSVADSTVRTVASQVPNTPVWLAHVRRVIQVLLLACYVLAPAHSSTDLGLGLRRGQMNERSG